MLNYLPILEMYPVVYYLLSAVLLAALIYLCRPANASHGDAIYQRNHSFRTDGYFLGLALLLLLNTHIPSIFYNRELNVDESQLLTQAITVRQDPVYGRSVDGTSIGPVNTYLLLLPSLFGLPFDYTTARLLALLLVGISLVLFYRSLLYLTTPVVSRLSFLPVLLFFSFTTEPNFLHYSSELTSLVILTACFGLVVRVLRQRTPPSLGMLFGLGTLAGLTIYCKLQTLPIIGILLGTLAIYLWSSLGGKSLKFLTFLAAGFLLPTILVFGQAYWLGTERYFIDYYFVGNLTTYSQIYAWMPLVNQGFLAKLIRFPGFVAHYSDFLLFIVLNLVLAAGTILFLWRRRFQANFSWTDALVLLIILGASWSVITPGTEFGHHLLLLVFPLGWGLTLTIQRAEQLIPNKQTWLRLATALLGLYVVEVVITDNVALGYARYLKALSTQSAATTDWQTTSNPYLFLFPDKAVLPLSPVSRVIQQYTRPTDQIAVWGWNCRYYVETGLAQGVQENHTQRSSVPNRMQNAYLNRYAQDLVVNRPAVFVDAAGKNSLHLTSARYQHEHFAPINRVITQDYSLVASIDQARVYVRRDRLAVLSPDKVVRQPVHDDREIE